MAIDQRVKPSSAQSATAEATRRAELAAAAGALLAYRLGGRQTDDVLLGEIQAAWVEHEAIEEQRRDQRLGRAGRGQLPSPEEISDQQRSAMGNYVAVLLGVPGLTGTPSRTAGRTVTIDQGVWPGGSSR